MSVLKTFVLFLILIYPFICICSVSVVESRSNWIFDVRRRGRAVTKQCRYVTIITNNFENELYVRAFVICEQLLFSVLSRFFNYWSEITLGTVTLASTYPNYTQCESATTSVVYYNHLMNFCTNHISYNGAELGRDLKYAFGIFILAQWFSYMYTFVRKLFLIYLYVV